jgi:hypothetical protein
LGSPITPEYNAPRWGSGGGAASKQAFNTDFTEKKVKPRIYTEKGCATWQHPACVVEVLFILCVNPWLNLLLGEICVKRLLAFSLPGSQRASTIPSTQCVLGSMQLLWLRLRLAEPRGQPDGAPMIAQGFDAHSSIRTPAAAGMPEVEAEADFNMIEAASCSRYQFLPRDLHLYAARIAAAEFKAELFKWLTVTVCAAGILFNAIVIFGTLVRVGVSLHH